MLSKLLAATLLASVVALPALAADSGAWRASKLVGVNVYNEQNEKLGDISEVLIDKAGQVEGVVIGVGGFLGMGQHEIKVGMSRLKFSNEPMRSVKESAKDKNTRATTGSDSRESRKDEHKWYPDHAVLSGASKDELKKLPEFKYN